MRSGCGSPERIIYRHLRRKAMVHTVCHTQPVVTGTPAVFGRREKGENMGYLIKSNVIDALEEDMHSTMMCYEEKQEKDIVEFCYECMRRAIEELQQYCPDNVFEDTGLTPEQIRELKERDTAKAPVDIDDEFDMYVCPSCNMAIGTIGDKRNHHFCLNCGQRLKFKEDIQ